MVVVIAETLTIAKRFRGPPESGNGGYTCGIVGRRIEAPAAEVTLRLPPPLERELSLEPVDGGVELHDGDTLVAEGRPLDGLEVEPPEPVALAEAAAAREASPLHEHHAWPMCFVCGPDRPPGDGMRVTCGVVDGRELVASPWETSDTLPHEDGELTREMVWSALDCPGGIAAMTLAEEPIITALGRLSARIDTLPRTGETYVAIGWPIDRDGRKHHTGSAIFTTEGELLACARATWIELKDDMLGART
jgi:hypothetical protein